MKQPQTKGSYEPEPSLFKDVNELGLDGCRKLRHSNTAMVAGLDPLKIAQCQQQAAARRKCFITAGLPFSAWSFAVC